MLAVGLSHVERLRSGLPIKLERKKFRFFSSRVQRLVKNKIKREKWWKDRPKDTETDTQLVKQRTRSANVFGISSSSAGTAGPASSSELDI